MTFGNVIQWPKVTLWLITLELILLLLILQLGNILYMDRPLFTSRNVFLGGWILKTLGGCAVTNFQGQGHSSSTCIKKETLICLRLWFRWQWWEYMCIMTKVKQVLQSKKCSQSSKRATEIAYWLIIIKFTIRS